MHRIHATSRRGATRRAGETLRRAGSFLTATLTHRTHPQIARHGGGRGGGGHCIGAVSSAARHATRGGGVGRRRMGWGAGARNDGGRGRRSVSEWRRAGPLRRGTDRNAVRRRISSANCDDFSANLDGDLAVRLERGEDVGELLVGERRLLLVAREVKLLHLDPVLLVRLLSRGLRMTCRSQMRDSKRLRGSLRD